MSENTKIEWCDHTFNPWEGCQKVGPGCDHCYAESRNARFAGGTPINWGPGAPRRRTSPANWGKPLQWNAAHAGFFAAHGRRQRVFCASLADVFDNEVPLIWLVELLDLIRLTPNLDWLLLTKRIGIARSAIKVARREVNVRQAGKELFEWLGRWESGFPPRNVWLGATIVNQEEANRDIPKLLAVPARVRFLSMEPLLGPVDLERPMPGPDIDQGGDAKICQPWLIQSGIDWVIVGGESGPYARITHPEWPRDLRDQCERAGVPFFFKQHGEWAPGSGDFGAGRFRTAAIARDGRVVGGGFDAAEYPPDATSADGWAMVHRAGKKAAGRLVDGRTHDEFPRGVA